MHVLRPQPPLLYDQLLEFSVVFHGLHSPESAARSESLPLVLDFCMLCVGSGSRDALRGACPLLSRAVQSNHYELYVRVQQWLEENAQRVIALLMDVVCFTGPLDVILKPAEVVHVVCESVGWEHLTTMLVAAMNSDLFAAKVDEGKRVAAVEALERVTAQGKRAFIQVLIEFGKSCRL